ncbi:unnamed protein product [Gadus morhua 'NCC']
MKHLQRSARGASPEDLRTRSEGSDKVARAGQQRQNFLSHNTRSFSEGLNTADLELVLTGPRAGQSMSSVSGCFRPSEKPGKLSTGVEICGSM